MADKKDQKANDQEAKDKKTLVVETESGKKIYYRTFSKEQVEQIRKYQEAVTQ